MKVLCVKVIIFLLFLVLICCSALHAETQEIEHSDHTNLEFLSRYYPSAKVSSMEGKVSVNAYQAVYIYSFKGYDLLPLKIYLDCQDIQLNNTTRFSLPSQLTGLSFGIEATTRFFKAKDSYFRISITPSFYTDNFEFSSSSFRLPINAYLINKSGEQWTFLAGVGIYPDFEYPLFPILGCIYSPNPKLSFNIVPKNPNISYALNNKLNLRLVEAGFMHQEYEADKDNLKNVVLRYREIRLGSGLTYALKDSLKVSISAGDTFNRSFKYKDEDLGKIILNNGVYAEFKAEIVM